MNNLSEIADIIHRDFEIRTKIRDQALLQARKLTRLAAQSIRATHREENNNAREYLDKAHALVLQIQKDLEKFPALYFAGYTQDAIKEYVEALITNALIHNKAMPTPDELDVTYATYLKGLSEVPGELRRRCLDILRQGYSQEAERLLSCMDEIYAVLVTMDFPDAITYGLRRQTDLVRGILERTRGDLTLSLREEQLKQSMDSLKDKLSEDQDRNASDPRL